MKPGAAVTVAGIFLPEPYTGFRAMRAGLLTSTYLEAQAVTHMKASYQEHSRDAALRSKIEVSVLSSPLALRCLLPTVVVSMIAQSLPLNAPLVFQLTSPLQ